MQFASIESACDDRGFQCHVRPSLDLYVYIGGTEATSRELDSSRCRHFTDKGVELEGSLTLSVRSR